MPRKRRDFPWVDTDDNGTHYVHWYDPGTQRTKRLSLRTRDPGEAQDRFAAFLVKGRDLFGPDRPAELTVRQALADYKAEHAHKTADARRIDNALVPVEAWFGDVPVKEIGVPECQRYIAARQGGRVPTYRHGKQIPPSDGTVALELAYLRAACRHAVKWKRLSPADMPVFEGPSPAPPREAWLFHDELDALRRAATGRAAAFIEIAYYTASRRKAVERLTWFQVDIEKRRIKLAKPGEKRSRKRRPVVPIDPALMPTLLRLRDEATNEYVLGSPAPIGPLFTKVARRAGLLVLPERDQRPAGSCSPHVLRHTRATHLLQAGKSPWAVANLLGDRLETVTAKYGHHCPSYLEEVLSDDENLGETMSETPKKV